MLTKINSLIMYVVFKLHQNYPRINIYLTPKKSAKTKQKMQKHLQFQATEGQEQLLATNFSIAYTVRLSCGKVIPLIPCWPEKEPGTLRNTK